MKSTFFALLVVAASALFFVSMQLLYGGGF